MDVPLTEEDWSKIQNALHGRDSKWQAIGIQLNVSHADLTKIKRDCGDNLEECNREMQIAWLKTGKATWRALVGALRSASVGLHDDAKIIETFLHDDHVPSSHPSSSTGTRWLNLGLCIICHYIIVQERRL